MMLQENLDKKVIHKIVEVPFYNFYNDLRMNFKNTSLQYQLEADLHRLNIIFMIDYTKEKNIIKINNINILIQIISELELFYKMKMYFIVYFCNQCVFGLSYEIINKIYSDTNNNIYLLDDENSHKIIKIQFSKNTIFVLVLGNFELVDTTFIREHILYIHYSISFCFEIYNNKIKCPKYTQLNWTIKN
jgi:hypothetical protein